MRKSERAGNPQTSVATHNVADYDALITCHPSLLHWGEMSASELRISECKVDYMHSTVTPRSVRSEQTPILAAAAMAVHHLSELALQSAAEQDVAGLVQSDRVCSGRRQIDVPSA